MKKIPLNHGRFALVDDEDYDFLIKWKWFAHYCNSIKSFYASRKGRKCDGEAFGTTIRMARVIMNAKKGEYVDHIKHNTLNNQRSNLRICTNAQNCMNKGPQLNNTSGYKGVYWHQGGSKWKSQIQFNKKLYHLGLFDDKHEAAKAYNAAAKIYHGEFAYTNIIKED